MSIVCATNFSDASQETSTAAARLALRAAVPLWLVHVLPTENVRAFGRPLLEAAEGALEGEARRLEALGAKVQRKLLTGEAAESIGRFAGEQRATLVVVSASSHATPFLGAGGTVDRLAQLLTLPLLVVRETGPLEAWARGEKPLRVMLGADRSVPFEACRDWVKGLHALGPVEVVAARVFWPQEEYQRFGLPRPAVFGEVTEPLRDALTREVTSLVAPLVDAGLPVRQRLELGTGRIADHLVAVADDEAVDLLVVGTHHRRAMAKLWSVSHHALRLARMSVACVPAAACARGADVPIPVVREVLVATDFSEAGNRAVPLAFSLLPNGGTVHLLHVAERPGEKEEELRARLEELVPRDAQGRDVRIQIEVLGGSDVATAIAQAAARYNVDVLCLGTTGRGGLGRAVLGSVTQQVMGRTDRPVMVVRPLES
ncbi:universal stress protein [Myxococcaceae bacterium GXIMD 01537]